MGLALQLRGVAFFIDADMREADAEDDHAQQKHERDEDAQVRDRGAASAARSFHQPAARSHKVSTARGSDKPIATSRCDE